LTLGEQENQQLKMRLRELQGYFIWKNLLL
jgi:hypothetical protein